MMGSPIIISPTMANKPPAMMRYDEKVCGHG